MIKLTILGQPVSKANSRQLVNIGGRMVPIKSKAALAYERDVLRQIPTSARMRFTGPVRFTATLFYESERSDLDESLLLDCLQDRYEGKAGARRLVQSGVYANDRQVRERHVFHRIDKHNPRAEVVIEALQAQQPALELAVPVEF